MDASSGAGRVVFEGPVTSAALGGSRFVRIYLPPSYETSARKRYPVLYVHDGQNAFTTVGPQVAFGWGNWQLDRIVTELTSARKLREIVVVAIDATEDRYTEYRGWARPYTPEDLASLKRPPPDAGDNRRFEAYARFLREELKPRIDRDYRTLPEAKHTGVLGASLGGICSVALAWQHPDTFGLAGSLSGSFQIEGRYALERVLKPYLGKPKPVRFYLDSGTIDYSGGDDGRKLTDAVAAELRRIGWKEGRNLRQYVDETPLTEAELSQTDLPPDKWKEAQRSQHNEFYWRLRVWRALTFLFPPD
jgi:predicted alpha/beta superfamily hydrolase